MRAHPFAALVTDALGQVTADHVPLVLYPGTGEHGALQGHIAHGNTLFRNTAGPIPALAIFQGPQGYVTPSWYPSKQDHGKVVPTWNYVIGHALFCDALTHGMDATVRRYLAACRGVRPGQA